MESRNAKKTGSAIGFSIVGGIGLAYLLSTSDAEDAVADAEAEKAERLSAARSIARDLDGSNRVLFVDDVKQALERVSDNEDLVVRLPDNDRRRESENFEDGTGVVTTERYDISDRADEYAACLTIENVYEDFEYDTTASAAPGAC